jgi:hypothetical protein
VLRRVAARRGGLLFVTCSMEFMKQVFPRLVSPTTPEVDGFASSTTVFSRTPCSPRAPLQEDEEAAAAAAPARTLLRVTGPPPTALAAGASAASAEEEEEAAAAVPASRAHVPSLAVCTSTSTLCPGVSPAASRAEVADSRPRRWPAS